MTVQVPAGDAVPSRTLAAGGVLSMPPGSAPSVPLIGAAEAAGAGWSGLSIGRAATTAEPT